MVTADRIAHDRVLQQTELENIRGTAWPGTVLRLFLPKVADHIDRSYRFRAPPSFVTDGTVDYSKQDNVTDVRTRLTTSGTADYTLLGRSLDWNVEARTVSCRAGTFPAGTHWFSVDAPSASDAGEVVFLAAPCWAGDTRCDGAP